MAEKSEYKDTLNLPKTSFSMKANLAALEPRILEHWNTLGLYDAMRKERRGCAKFILHDGPPYANGSIHIGHALNKILKDIVIKFKILQGYDCPFIIGWDCHGLPVEHQLFKELKLTKHDVDVVDFRKKAKDFALKFMDLQRNDFKRLGLVSDWDNPYLTLKPEYEYATMTLLGKLLEAGYIYRGRKPVNWCSVCETALAEAEVEYYDKSSDSIYFLFPSTEAVSGFQDVHFLVWTTTPWTLVSNVAVAVHPDLQYCIVEHDNKKIVVARDRIPALEEKFKASLKVLATIVGAKLEGLVLKHPFLERTAGVVLAEFVSREDGSGCVHIAPGHGAEDFSLTKKYDLPVIMPVDEKGVFAEPAAFKGKNILDAGAQVIAVLTQSQRLLLHEKISHSYPHCWRCKHPIIFRATFQWFLDVDHNQLRSKALAEVKRVRWVPSSGQERMEGMLLTRPDWCLSRQRLWGMPIPAVRCKACNEVTLHTGVIARVAEAFRAQGSDVWFTGDVTRFIPPDFECPHCRAKEFVKEFDILDVWFESGASFFSVIKANPDLQFPADLYLEGSDQHRGWFQVSLIPSVAIEKQAPFKAILTHGFVVDGEGRKMSKSLGNVIAPQEIIQKYGAEILRLWAAYSDYSEDVRISEEIIKQLVDIYRKVRNTIRYIHGNIYDYDESKAPRCDELLEVDRFMLAKAVELQREVTKDHEEFAFYRACQKIFNFCNLSLSSFYLDILKDRLYTFSKNSKERRSAQFVLSYILKILLKTIAPVLSFTAEEAYLCWDNLHNKKSSIFLTSFDDGAGMACDSDKTLLERWSKIIALRSEVLKEIEKQREQGIVGSSLEAQVLLTLPAADFEFFKPYEESLREIFIVSKVSVSGGAKSIRIDKAEGAKCQRCWNYRDDIGADKEFACVCGKCVTALKNV